MDFEDSDYESWGLINEQGELTNAGALLADESPIRYSRIFCTRWNGLDKAHGLMEAIDDIELSGGLINMLQQAVEFVQKHTYKAWLKTVDGRMEMPNYPERAVLEAIVNALIHRDYLDYGSEVHLDVFDNRMEIYSPGGMFDGTRVQDVDLMKVPSRRRNPVIADIFNRLKYMDRRGSGFKKIIGAYRFYETYNNGLSPQFRSEHEAFFITLWNLNYHGTKDGTKEFQRILELMGKTPNITIDKIAEETGVSRRQTVRYINELTESGLIERKGGRKNGYWQIIE